jgi:RHS repeat-associated protein
MTARDIYTIAGSATAACGESGDGGPATSALLGNPESVTSFSGVTLDSSGNLYIADTANSAIREVAANNGTQWSQAMTAGDIYTITGGARGHRGDGGPASAALLAVPPSVTVDPAGDLFITDNLNNKIREVTATAASPFPASPAPAGITITQPGGSQVTFYPPATGGCTAPYVTAGGYCTLPQNIGAALTFSSTTQTYTYTPAPGTSDTYSSNGALTGQSDAAGDVLAIAYSTPTPGSGNCPATATTCETVTSASGRALTIGSSASGLVTSVTDPMGRRWAYAYTGSDLTSATDPLGNVTSYTYGPGSTSNPLLANDLLTITSPNAQPGGPDAGDSTVNVYDPYGRVVSQTDPAGFKTTFSYCVSAATGNCLNTATGTGIVTVIDPDGNATVYDYQEGTLAAQSDFTGTTLTSEQDDIPTTSAGGPSGGTLLDSATFDGDQNEITYQYNSAGNVISAAAPAGVGSQTATTTAQFTTLAVDSCDGTAQASTPCSSSQAGPSAVAPGAVIVPPAAAPPAGDTYTLYDTDGNELYTTTGAYAPGATTASYQRTTYQLFTGNSVTLNGGHITCTSSAPSQALPCATIDADGVVTQLAYNSAGDLFSSATPDGNGTQIATTTYSYDSDGEQTSTTDPDGNLAGANAGNYTTTTTYDADGQKATVTQAGGTGATVTPRVTGDGYDANGNQTSVTNARGNITSTTYTADNEPALVTDPGGHETLTCYDGDGQTTQTVPPEGVSAGSLTQASCPSAYPAGYGDRLATDSATYAFSAAGYATSTTRPAPAGQTGFETTTSAYDANGHLSTVAAPPASSASGAPEQVTHDTYNSAGELAAQTTGYGTSVAATTSYCYDPDGDRTSVVMPDGNTAGTAACETSSPWIVSSGSFPAQAAYQTTSGYDSAGNLVSTTSPATSAAPAGATTTYTYDPAGNILTSTDPGGVTKTWTLNSAGLSATMSYSGSAAPSVAYTYDADGRQTGMTDGAGSSSNVYDPFGELTSATNGAGQIVGYGYNADGDTASVTYPLPSAATWASTDTVSYGYSKADVLNSVTDFNGHQIAITNNGDSLPSAESLGSSSDTISTTYDSTDTPSAIALAGASGTLQSFAYSAAPSGAILSETDSIPSAGQPTSYAYDARGQITSVTPGTGSALSYSFDDSANLTTLPAGAAGTYDHNGELIASTLSGTTTTDSYNADGERTATEEGSATMASGTWNGAHDLTAYDDGDTDMSSAAYDGNGLRAAATMVPAGGSAQTRNFVWDSTPQVPQLLMDSSNAYIYADGNDPAEEVDLSTGTISYLLADSLGSIRGVVNSSGSLTASTSYDAWGNPATAGGLTSHTPFGFAGGYTDPTGLLYLLNRYYDPAAGQFISVDPSVSQTLEPYAYANGNPLSETDPAGLDPSCGAGVSNYALIHDFRMERYPHGSGQYRDAPLYCGRSDTSKKVGWGYRHFKKHIWQVADGTWDEFEGAMKGALEYPLSISDGNSD